MSALDVLTVVVLVASILNFALCAWWIRQMRLKYSNLEAQAKTANEMALVIQRSYEEKIAALRAREHRLDRRTTTRRAEDRARTFG